MSRFSPIKSNATLEDNEVVPEPLPEIEPAPRPRPAHKSSALKVEEVTLTFNAAKNGLQLHFPDKPPEDIRAELKAAGWRWSFRNACWYHRDTAANKDFAERFVARMNFDSPNGSQEPRANGDAAEHTPATFSHVPAWRLRLLPLG